MAKSSTLVDKIAWGILGGILIWLILKVSGVINTPLILEYSPIFGAVYLAGWFMSKLNQVVGDIGDIKNDTKHIEKDMNVLRSSCDLLKKK